MSHTYAVLVISRVAFEEIRAKLDNAGYSDQIHEGVEVSADAEGPVIDMQGIAIQARRDRPATGGPLAATPILDPQPTQILGGPL